ncbi:hypothetical protein KR222_009632 [Zaprionus bogoriensis]|nr:hypothetical protein KR222_009632 [Zaprionus bogoriensis]
MRCLPVLLVVCGLLLSAAPALAQQLQARIVGGSTTTQSAVGGFVVNLRNDGTMFCGGSLVTPLYVITAAHCVYQVATSRLTVQGGVTKLTQAGVVRRVARYHIPSAYTSQQMNMDVAVVRLESAMQGSNINTVPLCSVQWRAGDYMRVSGWGVTRYGNSNTPTQLRTVQLQLIRKDTCQRMYSGKLVVQPSCFCAYTQGKDSCSGDSGGGAIYNGQLCGVVSAGIGCANPRYPGLYTSIHRARSFIDSIISS